MSTPPIVDWEKVRQLKNRLTPGYENTPYQVAPDPNYEEPPIQLQGVAPQAAAQGAVTPAAAPAAMPPGRRPGGPGRQPAQQAAPQAPPAVLAASRGVTGEPALQNVSRETSEPTRLPPEQDEPAFKYMDQVAAGVEAAMAHGRPDIAARIQGEYADLITGQYRAMETQYEMETLPRVKEMQRQLLAFKGQQLPGELATQANELALQAGAQQRRILAYAYGLERNDMTMGTGVQLLNQSKLVEPGVVIDRIQMGDMPSTDAEGKPVLVKAIMGVDASGQVVNLKNGTPFVFPVEQAEALFASEFGDKEEDDGTVVVPRGSQIRDKRTGSLIATNDTVDPNDRRGPSHSEELSSVKFAREMAAEVMGIDLTSMDRMIEGVDPAVRAEHARLTAIAGQLVRRGVDPEVAAVEVLKEWNASQASSKAGDKKRYEGPVPWPRSN